MEAMFCLCFDGFILKDFSAAALGANKQTEKFFQQKRRLAPWPEKDFAAILAAVSDMYSQDHMEVLSLFWSPGSFQHEL
jgi:hypothetical protein